MKYTFYHPPFFCDDFLTFFLTEEAHFFWLTAEEICHLCQNMSTSNWTISAKELGALITYVKQGVSHTNLGLVLKTAFVSKVTEIFLIT
jgi:hypothetical protein